MNIVIVGHPNRLPHIEKLQQHLNVVTTVIDTTSALSGHRTALRMAAVLNQRVIIMEDDAIPVVDFEKKAQEWFDIHPDNMVSFYLGTSRPRDYQSLVDERVRIADMQGRRDLQLPTLIHGVCYSIPADQIQRVVKALDAQNGSVREADFAVGAAWGRGVYYPVESLVQHRDDTPVERHPDRTQRKETRVARRLAAALMFEP